jgi:hypothetical protein
VRCDVPRTLEGMVFVAGQRFDMFDLNRANNGNQIKSDLAGFCYDPPGGDPARCKEKDRTGMFCKEREFLDWKKNQPQVHHVVPKKDTRNCPCGKNSVKNAAVISKQMNGVFSNKDLTKITNKCSPAGTEQEILRSMGQYNLLIETIYRLNRTPRYDISLLSRLQPPLKKVQWKKRKKKKS